MRTKIYIVRSVVNRIKDVLDIIYRDRVSVYAAQASFFVITSSVPFISLLTSILIGWVIGPKWITDEVTKNGESFKREKLYGILMRYVVPVVMLVLFFMSTGLWDIIFK